MGPAKYRDMSKNANDRHVLVIGGAGYIGNVMVRMMLGSGYRVRVLDALLYDHGSAIAGVFEDPGFSFVRGDLRDAGGARRARWRASPTSSCSRRWSATRSPSATRS